MTDSKVEVASHEKTRRAMQQVLDKLNVPLNVAWVADPNRDKHGEIELNSGTLFLYDVDPQQAWDTFLHECLEWKVRGFVKVYRNVINGLIEIIEKTCYKNKEEFLEFLPQVFRLVQEKKENATR